MSCQRRARTSDLRSLLLITSLLLFSSPVNAAMEKQFLYFPSTTIVATPAAVGLDFKDILFRAADGVELHGWFLTGRPGMPVILFCHCNAGNISHRIDNLFRLHQQGYPVFIYDYRGYGKSSGTPDEPGTYADGLAAWNWLRQQGYGTEEIVIFGRSLGAAIALQLALDLEPAALIIESAFTSVADMGREHYPVLSRLFGWMLSARYENYKKIAALKSPLLVIHGDRDSIVPSRMGRQLYTQAPEPKRLHLISGADHNDGFFLHESLYWQVWNDFLNAATLQR